MKRLRLFFNSQWFVDVYITYTSLVQFIPLVWTDWKGETSRAYCIFNSLDICKQVDWFALIYNCHLVFEVYTNIIIYICYKCILNHVPGLNLQTRELACGAGILMSSLSQEYHPLSTQWSNSLESILLEFKRSSGDNVNKHPMS